MITRILKHPRALRTPLEEIEAMDRATLERFAQRLRENPLPHHAPDSRGPLPLAPAARPIEALPAWAQAVAQRSPTRKGSSVRAQRWRAVVWDAERCLTVHLGVFDSVEARDAAVQAAKDRRAMGLPLKG